MRNYFSEMHSGVFFNLVSPRVEDVFITDIAHHLAQTCRFGGGTDEFFSVAEHSLNCRWWVKAQKLSAQTQLRALLHDAHEAYIGDITTPVKLVMGEAYLSLEWKLDKVIGRKFGITLQRSSPTLREANDMVWMADQKMLAIEAYWMMPSSGEGEHWSSLVETDKFERHLYKPRKLDSKAAEAEFLGVYNELVTQLHKEERSGATVATYAV